MTEVLKMLPEAEGGIFKTEGQFFTIRTDPKAANNVFIFFPAVYWLASGLVYATLSLNWLTCRLQTSPKSLTSERVTQILYKERCIKEQIYFELLYVSCI